jgi:hypothetical protein
MQVIVTYPGSSLLTGHTFEQERTWTWEAPGPGVTDALHQTWREFNVLEDGDRHIERQARSMMIGDLIEVEEGNAFQLYVVDIMGFTPLPYEDLPAWKRLNSQQRTIGLKNAREAGWLSQERRGAGAPPAGKGNVWHRIVKRCI